MFRSRIPYKTDKFSFQKTSSEIVNKIQMIEFVFIVYDYKNSFLLGYFF